MVLGQAVKPHVTCERKFQKVGCFSKDKDVSKSVLLITDRDKSSSSYDGYWLDWNKFDASLHRFFFIYPILINFYLYYILLLIISLNNKSLYFKNIYDTNTSNTLRTLRYFRADLHKNNFKKFTITEIALILKSVIRIKINFLHSLIVHTPTIKELLSLVIFMV